MAESQFENLLVATFLFIILTTMVATRTPKTLNGVNTKIVNGETTVGGMCDSYRLFQSRTHIFLSVVSDAHL